MKGTAESGYQYADVVLTPETKRFKSTSIEGFEEMIEEGYREAIEKMPKILEIFNRKPLSKNKRVEVRSKATII